IEIAGVRFNTVVRGTDVLVYYGDFAPGSLAPLTRRGEKEAGLGNDYIKKAVKIINEDEQANCEARLVTNRDGEVHAVVTRKSDHLDTASAMDVEIGVRELLELLARENREEREARVRHAMGEEPASPARGQGAHPRIGPRTGGDKAADQAERFD